MQLHERVCQIFNHHSTQFLINGRKSNVLDLLDPQLTNALCTQSRVDTQFLELNDVVEAHATLSSRFMERW